MSRDILPQPQELALATAHSQASYQIENQASQEPHRQIAATALLPILEHSDNNDKSENEENFVLPICQIILIIYQNLI